MRWLLGDTRGHPVAIARIILVFGALMVVLFLILGYWSWQRVGTVAETAQRNRQAAAEAEVEAAVSGARRALAEQARSIAEWGETRQQLADPTFYLHWRDKRVFSRSDLHDYVEGVALYRPDGSGLQGTTQDLTLPAQLPEAEAYIQSSPDGPLFLLFRPVPNKVPGNAEPMGYVGLRAELFPALRAAQGFRHLDPQSLRLPMPQNGSHLSPEEAAARIQYRSRPQSGVANLEALARRNLVYTTLLAWGLGVAFFLIVFFRIGRPIRRLASQITAGRRSAEVGQLQLPPTPLAETEEVRRALLDYEANLARLHEQLYDKNRELWDLARRDPLTGLPNRRLFQERLEEALAAAEDNGTKRPAIIYLDLDGFKDVNDSFGHPTGDAVLCDLVSRLGPRVPEGATVARVGGDEFLVLLEDVASAEAAADIARDILAAFREPFFVQEQTLFLSGSIGISRYPDGGRDATSLVKNADAAVFRAKDLGRNQHQFYSAELTASAEQRIQGEAELRRALEQGELRVFYQPQIELETGRLRGVEALVRWQHPERGLLGPGAFLPLAEETGLIRPLSDWVLGEACRQAAGWREAGLTVPVLAVNICADQIRHTDLAERISRLRREYQLPNQALELEVTEDSFMADLQAASEALRSLREQGVRVAIDDFGIGSSSLAYLKRLPIDLLKIDKSFISDAPEEADDQGIVRAILALGTSMDLQVLAEGVETRDQEEFLRREGCHLVQGFGYAFPMPEQDLRPWLTGTAPGTLAG